MNQRELIGLAASLVRPFAPSADCTARKVARRGKNESRKGITTQGPSEVGWLLPYSYSGKVLAVRRVTENNGKKTPGVDQEIWDTPEKKTQAVHALKRRGYQSQPLRRVYIPKSDGKTMRPLGIPTMRDRAQQALYLLALAPVVETTADKNSYGFRQQRSCADAMEQCFKALRSANTQWILEGDIKSCFDKISHDWLLAHVPIDRVILQKWLKSGYMEKHVLHETTDGTPQGGIAWLLGT